MRTLLGLSVLCLLALSVQSQETITFTPSEPVGVEGQSVIFTCSLPGGQVPNLERRLPDESFQIINGQTEPRVSVVVNMGVNAVFTLQNLDSSQDSGSVWRCSLGALTSPLATLTVQIPVRYDFVSNVTRDVVEGNNVMIDFGLTAFPTPTVTFYFNGNVLQSGAGITFDAGSITFSPVARTHAGEYLLDANNVAGNATLCFILNVQYRPAFEPFTDGALGMIVCNETTAEINCAVRTTQGGSLTCLASGRPTPTISGSPALANNQFVVTNAEAADAGTYSCNATNSVATVPRVYNLEVGDVPNGVDGLAFETSVETIGQQISVTVTFDFTDDSGVRILYFRLEVVGQTFSRTITRPEGTSVSIDLTIEEEDLAPGTYTVVVRAVNLLGDGNAREAMLEVNFNGAIAVASVSFLLTAVLMLFSVLLLN